MSDLREQLLGAFRDECREHVEGMAAALAAGTVDLEEAFRRAHSLKAAARVCDLGPPAALSQRLEALFGRLRQGGIPLGPEAVALAQRAVGALASWARDWEAGRQPGEPADVLRALDQALGPPARVGPDEPDSALLAAFQVEHREHLEAIRSLLAELGPAAGSGPEKGSPLVEEAFRRAHSLKGAARLVELRPAEAVAHALEALFARAREGAFRLNSEVLEVIRHGLDFIEDAAACLLEKRPLPSAADQLRGILEISRGDQSQGPGDRPEAPARGAADKPEAPARGPSPAAETLRINADHLDRLLDSAEQLLAEDLGQGRARRELDLLAAEAGELARECESARAVAGPSGRVGNLLRPVEEQVRALVRRARRARRLLRQGSATLGLLARQLLEDVRRARTVPAESVLHGFRKMVRDLARAEGKEVDFRAVGLDTQADRFVLQALKDSLMHVLRNAVTHGIEGPEERVARGKAAAGLVSLRLEARGPRLEAVVEDDGRGVDPARARSEAVRRGLLGEDEAEALGPDELAGLLFRPGFSTSAEVTDLAGRGMGLSVVQEAVRRLQGEAQLSSSGPGRGTRVTLSVALTVSAQRLLLVSCSGQSFAIPAHGVERAYLVRAEEVETLTGRPVVTVQGEAVPLVWLADLLGLARPAQEASELLTVVVVHSEQHRLAVRVDGLLGQRDALLKGLEPPARGPRWAGAVVQEDGSVCLVLSPAWLCRAPSQPLVPSPAPAAEEAGAAARPAPGPRTILVVDDSLTTRTLERSILEAHGYRVRLALDGLEALAKLRDGPADLVITDIQMPRLDGFGLLERMKKDPRLARIPVIVVSSCEQVEDLERGLALGADAYIVKRKFDHEELLQAVRQIL